MGMGTGSVHSFKAEVAPSLLWAQGSPQQPRSRPSSGTTRVKAGGGGTASASCRSLVAPMGAGSCPLWPRCQLTSPNTGLEIPLLGQARAPASPARRSFLRAVAVPDVTAELGCCRSRGDCVSVDVGHLPGAPRVLVAREAQPGRTWQAMKGDGFLPQPASRHVAKPLPLVRCHPGLSHLCAGHASEG